MATEGVNTCAFCACDRAPCLRYTDRLREAGIDSSVGSVGDSYDNALAESVIGLYKSEVIWHQGPWRNAADVEFATLEWVAWFNSERLLEPGTSHLRSSRSRIIRHRRSCQRRQYSHNRVSDDSGTVQPS